MFWLGLGTLCSGSKGEENKNRLPLIERRVNKLRLLVKTREACEAVPVLNAIDCLGLLVRPSPEKSDFVALLSLFRDGPLHGGRCFPRL